MLYYRYEYERTIDNDWDDGRNLRVCIFYYAVFNCMKVGDLVIDDKSHMDPSNIFYDAFKRLGVVMSYHYGIVEILWTNGKTQWTTKEHASKLVVISENR